MPYSRRNRTCMRGRTTPSVATWTSRMTSPCEGPGPPRRCSPCCRLRKARIGCSISTERLSGYRPGDPGLGAFTDDGTPGHGHFPLLPTSQAIDAGNDAVCPDTDQLGQPRVGPCDIGAIEFQG